VQGSVSVEQALCYQWPAACAYLLEGGYSCGHNRDGSARPCGGHPGTLVQFAEVLQGGGGGSGVGMVSAADTKRVDSGACGALP
jgi:hypothetical protein